jgi:hypothetical protein
LYGKISLQITTINALAHVELRSQISFNAGVLGTIKSFEAGVADGEMTCRVYCNDAGYGDWRYCRRFFPKVPLDNEHLD